MKSKKQILNIVSLFIGLLLLYLIRYPLKDILLRFSVNNLIATLYAKNFILVVVIIIALSIINRHFGLKMMLNLRAFYKIYNFHLLIIPLTIVGIASYSSFKEFNGISQKITYLYLGLYFLVGLAEELVFRGIFLYLFLNLFSQNRFKVIYAVLFSSILFGFAHFINYIKVGDIEKVISQVIFAFSFGCFASGIFLKTRNIYIIALIHALFDIGFGDHKFIFGEQQLNYVVNQSTSLSSFLFSIVIFSSLVISGLYMAVHSQKLNFSPESIDNTK